MGGVLSLDLPNAIIFSKQGSSSCDPIPCFVRLSISPEWSHWDKAVTRTGIVGEFIPSNPTFTAVGFGLDCALERRLRL